MPKFFPLKSIPKLSIIEKPFQFPFLKKFSKYDVLLETERIKKIAILEVASVKTSGVFVTTTFFF